MALGFLVPTTHRGTQTQGSKATENGQRLRSGSGGRGWDSINIAITCASRQAANVDTQSQVSSVEGCQNITIVGIKFEGYKLS